MNVVALIFGRSLYLIVKYYFILLNTTVIIQINPNNTFSSFIWISVKITTSYDLRPGNGTGRFWKE